MASTINGVLPTPDDVKQAVNDVYAAHGYVNSDTGRVDQDQIHESMLEKLSQNPVGSKRERRDKSVPIGDLVAHVFPDLPQPESFDEQENPVLARDVWNVIVGKLYEMTRMSASGPLQRKVSEYMGNGYLLLRCQRAVGTSLANAVYLSDDFGCIDEDLVNPENRSLRNKIESVTRTREMLIARQPGNATKYARRAVGELKAVQEAASQRIMLAAAGAAERTADKAAEADSEPEGTES